MGDMHDINLVTSDKVGHLSQQNAINKAKKSSETKSAISEALAKGKAPEKDKKPKTMKNAAAQFKSMNEQADVVLEKKLSAQKLVMLKKIHLYESWLPGVVPSYTPGRPSPYNAMCSAQELKSTMDQIYSTLSSQNIKPNCRKMFMKGIGIFEELVMVHGYNPMGYNISGVTKALEAKPELLETELTELAIELYWIFEQGLYVRLAMKLDDIFRAYTKEKGKLTGESMDGTPSMEREYDDM